MALYEDRNSEIAGIGIFATQKIPQGQRIMSSRPLILNRSWKSVPTSYTLRKMCLWAGWAGKKAKSPEELQVTQMLSSTIADNQVKRVGVKLAQLIGQLNALEDDEVDNFTDSDTSDLSDIEQNLLKVFTTLATQDYLHPQMQRRAALFLSNRIFLNNRHNNGSGIFEEVWKINHSCRPNAYATWCEETQRMNIHALRAIKPGKEICISYIPACDNVSRRCPLS